MDCVAIVKRNSAGQIFIEDADGNSFDMSKHVGQSLYNDALIHELHELRKDKQRMDFLEKNAGYCFTKFSSPSEAVVSRIGGEGIGYGSTQREAIDDAILKQR